MKSLLVLLFLIASGQNIFAQSSIKVSLDQGRILLNGQNKDVNVNVPFTLLFDVSIFKDKQISIYTTHDKNKPLFKGVFGKEISKPGDGAFYKITLLDKSILDVDKDKQKISGNSILVKIDNSSFSNLINFSKVQNVSASSENIENLNINKEIIYQPGSIVLDAITLSAILKKKDIGTDEINTIELIKKKYSIDPTYLKSNVFLKDGTRYLLDTSFGSIQSGNLSTGVQSLLKTAGNLDVTAFADGLAKFIVKRTKEELSINFFKKFKQHLGNYPDLKTVFPATEKILQAIDSEIYNYSNYINNLRAAFKADLLTLDNHLPGIIENHLTFFRNSENFQYELALRTGCFISVSLRHNMHPGDILSGYPLTFFDLAPNDSKNLQFLKGSIQSLQLISESMIEGDAYASNYWVGMNTIRQLVNDPTALKIYLGLMVHVAALHYDSIPFDRNTSFYSLINTQENLQKFNSNYQPIKQYLLTFGNRLDELNKMIQNKDENRTDSAKIEYYTAYFKASSELLQQSVQVVQLPLFDRLNELKTLDSTMDKYFKISHETADIVTAINRKNYSDLVNHLLIIYKLVVQEPTIYNNNQPLIKAQLNGREKKALADTLLAYLSKYPNATFSSITNNNPVLKDLVSEKDSTNSVIVLESLAKYGAFMANMVEAKNSDEVAAVIEAAALPAGSARIKRESKFNVALNTYPGLFVGREDIRGLQESNRINVFGLTAPVGFSISKGRRILPLPLSEILAGKTKASWSSSWFISLIDIGAVASFRFKDPNVAQVPTILLKDIISPGIFYSLGIPETPLSINVGVQVGPNLRKVNIAGNDYSQNMYVRYSASFCIDIPIFNLYTK